MRIKHISSILISLLMVVSFVARSDGGTADLTMNNSSVSDVISIPNYVENTRSITTDILFFYTELAIQKAGGVDELNDYIQKSVLKANLYMSKNKIAIERRVAAVLPYDGMVNENSESIDEILNTFYAYAREEKTVLEPKYKASYYVLVVGNLPDNKAGHANLGGYTSVIMPFEGDGLEEYSLAHELGHSDGLVHTVNGGENFKTTGGSSCGSENSLMHGGGNPSRSDFLSSPDVINTLTGESCGLVGDADVRGYYYDAVENNRFISSDISFRDYVKPRERTGTVTYSLVSESYEESDGVISVMVSWSGVNDTDSSVEVYSRSLTTSDGDYTFENKRLNLDSESGQVVVEIAVNDDNDVEDVEYFEVGLRYQNGVNVGTEPTELSIISDDMLPKGDIEISGTVSLVEGETGTILVTRTGGSRGQISAVVQVVNGTASDADYNVEVLNFTLEDGETSKEILFTAVDDSIDEIDENLVINISTEDQESVASGSISVTIIDNDPPPVVTTPSQPSNGNNSGGGGSFGYSTLLLLLIVFLRNKGYKER